MAMDLNGTRHTDNRGRKKGCECAIRKCVFRKTSYTYCDKYRPSTWNNYLSKSFLAFQSPLDGYLFTFLCLPRIVWKKKFFQEKHKCIETNKTFPQWNTDFSEAKKYLPHSNTTVGTKWTNNFSLVHYSHRQLCRLINNFFIVHSRNPKSFETR